MKARELDALIATKMMGFSLSNEFDITHVDENGNPIYHDVTSAPDNMKLPSYSTDIAAAWAVVEKLSRDKHFEMNVCLRPHAQGEPPERFLGYMAHFSNGTSVIADTAPRAICLAALSACGVIQYQQVHNSQEPT